MTFFAYHGTRPEERALGQRFTVDVALEADLHRAGVTDDISDTISYSRVYRVVREVVEGEPRNLLEAVAQAAASRLLSDFPLAQAVRVRVAKPGPPIKGAYTGEAAVQVRRARTP
ncbi:MAG: dihydroneopterin aldolase [Chloroflexi bacterium]|nr:dihydroneopterin aldolase [Chloroflexota bacterium]